MNSRPTKILVVDDSALYRQSIQNVLRKVEGADSVGSAKNGVDALEKIERFEPDLLTLDVQMPDMNGIELLREIKRRRLRSKAIMVSSFTAAGAQVTTDALMEGAFDFILKPSGSDPHANRQQLQDELQEKISAFRESSDAAGPRRRTAVQTANTDDWVDTVPAPKFPCQIVVLGTSTGGPVALKALLPKLPADLPIPVLVVQHMPPTYTQSLAARLNSMCELEVLEATNEMEAIAGRVIIAAGGQHLKLISRGDRLWVRLTDDPPENGVRPSVDYTLRSTVDATGGNALAVIMTGMGRDGLEGCRGLKQSGGFVFAQNRSDCVVYGMPKVVIEEKLADRTLPLAKLAPGILRHIKRSRRT
ncbi:protein-glutamate methylesterase/protein-glutamine glutaminase [Novipirellula sp. SH528]|uniref:protein-glutamate methylesterase/protein-glutamine glutaminase n=1 Tax=Novipirellula sp. SH528 TaxID=3454466 RepID=UPI003FA08D1D